MSHNLINYLNIFLNFKYFDAKKDVSREGDLLILCNEGFLVIEIKENLEFYDGRFVQKANPPRVVQPVEQAEDSLQGFLDLISEDLCININKIYKNTGVISWGSKVNLENLTSFHVQENRGFVKSLKELEDSSRNLGGILKNSNKIKLS